MEVVFILLKSSSEGFFVVFYHQLLVADLRDGVCRYGSI